MKRIGFGALCLQPILVERTLAEIAGDGALLLQGNACDRPAMHFPSYRALNNTIFLSMSCMTLVHDILLCLESVCESI